MAHEQNPEHETGVAVPEGHQEKEAARPRERKANAALDLKLAGYQYEEIAQVLGFPSGKAVLIAIERAREKHLTENPDTREKMRDYASRRLERLLRATWAKAIDPDNPEQSTAQQRALAIIDRHAKLHGLDAPTQHIVHTPTQQEIDQWVAEVRQARGEVVEEGDIFGDEDIEDAEIVEDDPKQIGA